MPEPSAPWWPQCQLLLLSHEPAPAWADRRDVCCVPIKHLHCGFSMLLFIFFFPLNCLLQFIININSSLCLQKNPQTQTENKTKTRIVNQNKNTSKNHHQQQTPRKQTNEPTNPKPNKQTTPNPKIKEKSPNVARKEALRGAPSHAGGRCLTPRERETAAPAKSGSSRCPSEPLFAVAMVTLPR